MLASMVLGAFEITMDWLLLICLIPFVSRAILAWCCLTVVERPMAAAIRDTATHRAAILAIAGFSITIFAGLAVLDTQKDFHLAAAFAAVSFVAYFAAYSIQTYKWFIWIDLVGDAFMDTGSLSLVLAMMCVFHQIPSHSANWVACILGPVVWSIDHVVKWVASYKYFRELRNQSQ